MTLLQKLLIVSLGALVLGLIAEAVIRIVLKRLRLNSLDRRRLEALRQLFALPFVPAVLTIIEQLMRLPL